MEVPRGSAAFGGDDGCRVVSRRGVLSLAVAASVAGCTSVGESDRFRAFEERVRGSGVDVKRLAEDYRRWILEYYPVRESDAAFEAEVFAIAELYAETVPAAGGGGHERLKCITFDASRTRTGSYEVLAAWARGYAEGSVSRETYLDRVLGTRGA